VNAKRDAAILETKMLENANQLNTTATNAQNLNATVSDTNIPSSPSIHVQNPSTPNPETNIINPNTTHPSDKTASLTQKRVMDEYNRAFSLTTDREKLLTLKYFMALASIENESNLYLITLSSYPSLILSLSSKLTLPIYQNQMEVLDHLVHKLREQE
jgi:hypothetical protein